MKGRDRALLNSTLFKFPPEENSLFQFLAEFEARTKIFKYSFAVAVVVVAVVTNLIAQSRS